MRKCSCFCVCVELMREGFFWLLVRESSCCWKSLTVGVATSELPGVAGEPRVDVPLKSCSLLVKLKYILILVLSFGLFILLLLTW